MAKTLIKTPCATAALSYFGVVGATWNERTQKNVWPDTLRRAGYAVRSRMSRLGRGKKTVGQVRNVISHIAEGEPEIRAFIVRVEGHVLVLSRDGQTVVDTAPRVRDRRVVKGCFAVI